jgi:DUF4097 and DUF4098 domain-containing protein YvlB
MSEEAKMILEMLRDGKITADEATRLLNAAQPAKRTHESEGAFFSDLREAASEVVQRARKEAKEAVRRANEVLRAEERDVREQARELAKVARDEMREKLREAKQRLKEMRRELKQRLRRESAAGDLAEETEEEIESMQEDIDAMQEDIDEMQEQVEEMQDEIEEFEDEDRGQAADDERREPGVLANVISVLGGGQTYHWQENLSGELPNVPVPHIAVRGVNGRVVVELTDDAKWHLTAEKSARAANAAEAKALSRNLYSVETTAEGLVIAAKKVFGQARAVNFHLRLPQSHVYDLDLSSVNGSVRVQGVAAKRLRASTTNGQVAVESTASEISLSSVNGRVELCGAAASVACRTVNGSLAVTCPTLQAGTMTLDTVNGSITVRLTDSQDVGLKIKGSNVHGSVEAEGLGLKVDVVRHTVGRQLRAESEGNFPAWLEVVAKSVHGSINIAPAR